MKNNIKINHNFNYPFRFFYFTYLMILTCLSVIDAFSDDGNIVWSDCRNLTVEGKGWTDTFTPLLKRILSGMTTQ
jgi:hypothetical protein